MGALSLTEATDALVDELRKGSTSRDCEKQLAATRDLVRRLQTAELPTLEAVRRQLCIPDSYCLPSTVYRLHHAFGPSA